MTVRKNGSGRSSDCASPGDVLNALACGIRVMPNDAPSAVADLTNRKLVRTTRAGALALTAGGLRMVEQFHNVVRRAFSKSEG